MATTVNGWPVLTSNRTTGTMPRLRKVLIPGANRHIYIRDGACALVLAHVALWFHESIERLDLGVWDEWGWAVRPVRGQRSGYSNHAGGVAIDLNATRHPIGVSPYRTFTTAQITLIRLKLRVVYLGLVIWGGVWSRPDGMHFEVAETSIGRLEALAKVLMRTPRGKRILAANPGLREAVLS